MLAVDAYQIVVCGLDIVVIPDPIVDCHAGYQGLNLRRSDPVCSKQTGEYLHQSWWKETIQILHLLYLDYFNSSDHRVCTHVKLRYLQPDPRS